MDIMHVPAASGVIGFATGESVASTTSHNAHVMHRQFHTMKQPTWEDRHPCFPKLWLSVELTYCRQYRATWLVLLHDSQSILAMRSACAVFTMLLSFILISVGIAGLSASTPVVFEPSYAELAASLIPAQFNLALSQLNTYLTPTSQPDGVKTLRINLLKARELLDMFSYAYPNTTASEDAAVGDLAQLGEVIDPAEVGRRRKRTTDLYLQIRQDLDGGYEVLGAFQDLAHSLVKYNESDVEQYRARCLQWQDSFMSHLFLRTYTTFLSSPDPERLYYRPASKLSKLFWGYKGTHPDLSLSGTANMAMLAASLMAEAADQLPTVLNMVTIYEEPLHSQFHLYRKLVRSLVSVLESCPSMMSSEKTQRSAVLAVMRPWAAAWRRATAAATAALFGRPRDVTTAAAALLLRGAWHSRSLTAAAQGGRLVAPAGAAGSNPLSLGCPAYDDFLKTLGRIFHDMGQVNNWIVSYDFYVDRGMAAEAEDSRQQVVDMWGDVSQWMADQDLPGQLGCISRALIARWHLPV